MRVTYTKKALLQISFRLIDGSAALSRPGGNGFRVEGMTFTDKAGLTWKRSRDGFLTRTDPPRTYLNQDWDGDRPSEGDPFSPIVYAQIQKVEGCSPT
ncbi:hypothetical protein ACFUTV_40995 [Streptomyces sp. NPDC057298]|uniref:hypothetical protein n=1 Tax=Streptomyces sp. NPDC057298 TaxID=3346091 RepID=UPI0036431B20